MSGTKLHWSVILISLWVWFIGSQPMTTAAQTSILHVDPAALGVRSGDQATLNIEAVDVAGLYGVEFHLTFDPAVIEVVDADAATTGVQLMPGDWLQQGFAAINTADNAAGKIDFAATLLNPAPPLDGRVRLASFTVRAKVDGVTAVKLDRAILATRDATEIAVELQSGLIRVSADGQPPAPGSAAPSAAIDPVLIGAAGAGLAAFIVALVVVIVVIKRSR